MQMREASSSRLRVHAIAYPVCTRHTEHRGRVPRKRRDCGGRRSTSTDLSRCFGGAIFSGTRPNPVLLKLWGGQTADSCHSGWCGSCPSFSRVEGEAQGLAPSFSPAAVAAPVPSGAAPASINTSFQHETRVAAGGRVLRGPSVCTWLSPVHKPSGHFLFTCLSSQK